jgi:DNA primase
MSVIDEVKQRIDIVEIIGQTTKLTKAGKTFKGTCPFHSEKNPSFYVYPDQQSWHCFGACSTGGDVFSFIMKKDNIDFGEALRQLAERAGVTIPDRFESDSKREENDRLYQANKTAAEYFAGLLANSPAAEKARNYLAGRGISQKSIAEFQLGYSMSSWDALKNYLVEKGYTEAELVQAGLIIETDDKRTRDRFRHHIMFPIKDIRGRVTGFGARVLDDSLPKYINSPQTPLFDKSGSLYAIDLAAPAIRKLEIVVMVEGYMDVITAHQYGFTNVIAPMGTSITDKQLAALKRVSRNVHLVLALDPDSAGQAAMLKGAGYENVLESEVRVSSLPDGKDPDEVIKADPKAWEKLIGDAQPVMNFMFDTVTAGLDLKQAADKRAAVDRLAPAIVAMQDAVRRAHYIQKLANVTGSDIRTMESVLNQMKETAKPHQSTIKEVVPATRRLTARPVEDECLALLLQNPALMKVDAGLNAEYFDNSENRVIFQAWGDADGGDVKLRLDEALFEHYDELLKKQILALPGEERYNKLVLRLREDYLKGLERKRAAALNLGAEPVDTPTELARQKETSNKLREVFAQKSRLRKQGR